MTDLLRFRRTIMRFLGSASATNAREVFVGVEERAWERNLRWLDRSGLALSLAARFEVLRPGVSVPAGVGAALRARLLDNQRRMERMLEFFHEAAKALSAVGARYCCVKGFSLIPDCLDEIRERHQVDFDFLVAPEDLKLAQGAIESLGYRVQHAGASGEVRMIRPWKKHIGVNGYLYQLPEPPPIELHTRMWEPDDDEVEFPSLLMFPAAMEPHEVSGVEFPRLRPAQQIVHLLLHIFRHLLGSWTRLISLYEVATFIRSRSADDELWAEVARLIGKDSRLASACALVLGLVDAAFPQDLPEALQEIYAGNLSSDSALWISRCATAWLLADPPGNKLSLLVQKQFWRDRDTWRRYVRRRLLPIRPLHPLSDEAVGSRRKTLGYCAEEARYQASRVWYHAKSDCTYLMALMRWNRRRRINGPLSQAVDGF